MKLPEGDAPKASKNPTSHTYHGITIKDDYNWLRDPLYPDVSDKTVLAHLEAENAYYEAFMKPYKDLQITLFEEMKGRIPAQDSSVPVKDGDFVYWWRFEKEAQYRQWYRKAVTGGVDELLLDEVKRAQGHDFYQLGDLSISPDGQHIAIAEDINGDERYTVRVRRVGEKEDWQVLAAGTSGRVVWDANSQGILVVELNENHRPYLVKYIALASPDNAEVLYEERDEAFFVGIGRTQSQQYLMISAGDHITSEVHLIPAENPLAEPLVIAKRRSGLEYDVDHAGETLFIRTNDVHRNFRIVTAKPEVPGEWVELIAPSDQRYIRGFTAFKGFLAVEERIEGLDQVFILPHGGAGHYVDFPEEAYTAGLGANPEYDVTRLRLSYQSMVTPPTVYDYDIKGRVLEVLKVQEIPSGYDKEEFVTERLMARADDGTAIPISIVYKKDFQKNGAAPLHLYGYGAYGIGMSASFSTARLSLLERGFAFAIAHIRGGDELGYSWYQDGKLFKRWQTFTDFIACARHLIDEGYARAGGISISGGSAGGTLMGVAANIAPNLWRAIVAHVPFVDVLNTMLDADLPLTPIEWPEWGNPVNDPAAFAHIRSYSPYDNVIAQDYPPLMVTAGLHDPRVTYWEPAKWVAKLRDMKTDDNPLIFKTNMGAGHRGKTGRYAALEEVAEEYTFLLIAAERA